MSEKFQKFIGNSNGMFVIENESMTKGAFITWKEKYRLRHLLTNKYLKMSEESEKSENQLYDLRKLALADSKKDSMMFQFQIIYSTLSTKDRDL